MKMDDTDSEQGGLHLCILIHGFWGNPDHLKVMDESLLDKIPTLHTLVAKSNSGNFTYDGIELGGERVCREIEDEIEKLSGLGQRVTRLSVVGYSLGGLIARYAVGLLDSKGIFKDIQPVNFTTFASPHLGVRAPLRGWHNDMWNVIGARTLLTSGQQLFLIDNFRNTGRRLLEILADPNSIFMLGLAKFQRRTLYANITNDRSAVYYTTSITKIDPFTKLDKIKVTYLEGYEDVIVDPGAPLELPEKSNATVSSRIWRNARRTMGRLPFFVALVAYVPLGIITVLVNSGMEALRSNRRIRLYEQGLSSIQPDAYRVPLLITGIQEAVEGVYKNVNSAQNHEYLPSGVDEEATLEGMAPPQVLREDSKSSTLFSNHPNGPILALTPAQFRMIEALDNVGWRKFLVHIHKHRHSHAAIIVRGDKRHTPNFDEGRVVFRHWLDEEFIM